MGALLSALLAAFGPQIGELIAGIGTFLINELTKLLGDATSAAAKAEEAVTAGERITMNVTTDPLSAMTWVKGKYASFDDLEADMPGSMQAIQAKSILMSDVGVPHSIAAHAVQLGLANGRVKQSP